MNILLVSALFPPIRTGTSFYASNLAVSMAGRGHRVAVAALQHPQSEPDRYPFPVHRLPALRLPLPRMFNHFYLASLFPRNFSRLSRLARDLETDVILVVNHYLDIVFPACFAARRNGIPLVCSVGTQLQSPSQTRQWVLRQLDRLICGNLVFPFCQRIIAWDTEILRYLEEVHGRRVTGRSTIVNFGPNVDGAQPFPAVSDYRLKRQILGVGAVTEQRDFVALVLAFADIASEFPELRIKIIGHVYHDAAVRAVRSLGLGDKVIFTGELPHEQVQAEMRASDVFYVSLSGRYLGLGTATLEAMTAGIPVMANVPVNLLGGDTTLRDMEDFAYADRDDRATMAERLRLLLRDERLREAIGQAGRRFVERNLNWEKVAQDMERVLLDAAHPRAAR